MPPLHFSARPHRLGLSLLFTLLAALAFAPAGLAQTVNGLSNPPVQSVSLTPASVTGGSSSTGKVVLSDFNGLVTLTVKLTSDNPAVTVPATVSVAPSALSATFPMTTTAVTGQTVAHITATGNLGITKTATLTVNPAPVTPNFSLSSYPARLTVTQGLSNTANLSVIPANGFSGNVTLTNSALPAGVTIAYGTNPTSGASTVTFTAAATAALGVTPITITGTSGSLNSSVTIPLTVAPVVSGSSSNVALAFSTGEVPLTAGSAAGGNVLLAVTPVNGYTGPISFATTGLPSGVSVATNPTALSITGIAAQTAQVTFQATTAATPGYYPVGITGSGNGGATDTAIVGLNILPPPNSLPFTLTVTDDTTNAIPTGIASATVSLATSGGYSNPITLSLADDPSAPVLAPANTTDPTKIGVSFSVPTLSVSGTSALTLTIGASVAPGAYHFVVNGLSTDGSAQRAAFTVFVIPEDLAIVPDTFGSSSGQTYTGDNPPYPLAAGIGDMQRLDSDPANTFEIGTTGHIAPSTAISLGLHPNAPIGVGGLADGTDDRQYVGATIAPPYVYPYRSCIRIFSVFPNRTGLVGSGTLIGKNHVLTAAHLVFDPSRGGQATITYMFPGFDYNWSRSHSTTYTTANHTFVAKGYLKGATFASNQVGSIYYDDWAVIDCNPITNGPTAQRGQPLGNYTQYMQIESTQTVYPSSVTTYAAGYPALTYPPATPVGLGASPKLFQSFTYNGDDGPVNETPSPNLFSDSTSLLFSSMDVSSGDSGLGLWYLSDNDNDYHVYGVIDGIFGWRFFNGLASGITDVGNQITISRYSIIKTHERLDGDEPSAVYSP